MLVYNDKLIPTGATTYQFLFAYTNHTSELPLKLVPTYAMAEMRLKHTNKYKVTYLGGPLF